ncbi:MAG TPA: hypothetical protein VKU39_04590 [Streptosporangiaceae bacterium]|nr:hypothetical protein [Streptosporangiaceae bacterium]
MMGIPRRRSGPQWSGLGAAALTSMLVTTLLLRPHATELAVVNAARPTPPAPVAKVTGIATTGLRVDRAQHVVLVLDNHGFPLYFYSRDHDKPSASSCFSQCAVDWPPVLAGHWPLLTGIPAARIGELRRPDGLLQLTLDGRPLYRYRGDTVPGVSNGNGINATWFLIGPDGRTAIPLPRYTLPPNDPAMGNLEGDE